MKKGILIAIFSLFLVSGFIGCHNGSRHVEILSRDTLIDVLADLHISESAYRLNSSGPVLQNTIHRNAYCEWVMQKHHITFQQFDTSFKYYLNDNERFSKMYDQVINKIKQKELENKRTPKEELVRKDSIHKDSLQKVVLQKAAFKKDSIRIDSINKVNLKKISIQKEAARKDSIKNAATKKASYKKEEMMNESLKKSLSKNDSVKNAVLKKSSKKEEMMNESLKKSLPKKDSVKQDPVKNNKTIKPVIKKNPSTGVK